MPPELQVRKAAEAPTAVCGDGAEPPAGDGTAASAAQLAWSWFATKAAPWSTIPVSTYWLCAEKLLPCRIANQVVVDTQVDGLGQILRADRDRRVIDRVHEPCRWFSEQGNRCDVVGHVGWHRRRHVRGRNPVGHRVRGDEAHDGRALGESAEHHLGVRAVRRGGRVRACARPRFPRRRWGSRWWQGSRPRTPRRTSRRLVCAARRRTPRPWGRRRAPRWCRGRRPPRHRGTPPRARMVLGLSVSPRLPLPQRRSIQRCGVASRSNADTLRRRARVEPEAAHHRSRRRRTAAST